MVRICPILTTAANQVVAPFHGRMPVILLRAAYGLWFAGGGGGGGGGEVPLEPYPADDVTTRPVGARVNRSANDDPRRVEAADPN